MWAMHLQANTIPFSLKQNKKTHKIVKMQQWSLSISWKQWVYWDSHSRPCFHYQSPHVHFLTTVACHHCPIISRHLAKSLSEDVGQPFNGNRRNLKPSIPGMISPWSSAPQELLAITCVLLHVLSNLILTIVLYGCESREKLSDLLKIIKLVKRYTSLS